jgi:hypothetical protein
METPTISTIEKKHFLPKNYPAASRQKYTVIINNRLPYEFDFITALEFAIKYQAWYLEPSSYNTVVYQSSLNEEEKLNLLKESKEGRWYDGWVPYCLACSTMMLMDPRPYGFECSCCGNMIGFNLMRLEESPLNSPNQ